MHSAETVSRGLAVALACALLASCSPEGRLAAEGSAAGGGDALAVHRGVFERTVVLTGEIQAANAIELTVPRTPSWQVEVRWLAEDGSLVAAGERVAELDSSSFAGDLEEKEIGLAEKRSEREKRAAEILGDTRQKELEVVRRAGEVEKAELEADLPNGIIPRQELEERRMALDKARQEHAKALTDVESQRISATAQLGQLDVEIEKAQREIAAARDAIAELVLRAPVPGLFLVGDHPWEGRKLQVGDVIWVGLTVGSLPDLRSLVVETRLPDVDDGAIAPGMAARVVLDTYPADTYNGRVERLTPMAQEEQGDSLRRFFTALIDLDETDPERMIPGMSARVEVLAERREDVLLAPRAALAPPAPSGGAGPSGPTLAFLPGGATREVRLGPCNALECVVEEGLEDGVRLARRPAGTGLEPAPSAPAEATVAALGSAP